MISYYQLVIQYKGTHYKGWQVQPEEYGDTVQGVLNKVLETVSKSSNVKSLGSGRTDAGVHALGQVVKIGIPLVIAPENLIKALNVNLPNDIRVISVKESDELFLPTVHAKSKEYHYRFTMGRSFNAFQGELVANYPFELDVDKMQKACEILKGRHDFVNYFCEGTEVKSNVREIFECEILKVERGDWSMLPSHYTFRIVGDGFLKQMVRLLMGAIWNVGRGKISLEEFKNSLSSPKVERLGPVAPPEGLYLFCVNY